jgi:hypothetical protein
LSSVISDGSAGSVSIRLFLEALLKQLAPGRGFAPPSELGRFDVARSSGNEEVLGRDHVKDHATLLRVAGYAGGIGAVVVVFEAVYVGVGVSDHRVRRERLHISGADLVVRVFLVLLPAELADTDAGQQAVVEHVRQDVQAGVLAEQEERAILGRDPRHLNVVSAAGGERDDLLVGREHLKDRGLKRLDALKHVLRDVLRVAL